MMKKRDVLVTICLLVGISALLIVSGSVGVSHENGETINEGSYSFDAKRNFVSYYDEHEKVTLGYYLDREYEIFYYCETTKQWIMLKNN